MATGQLVGRRPSARRVADRWAPVWPNPG